MPTTYWDYIRVEQLLGLQGGNEDDESRLSNHEVVFITVHQVFELWFKLALRELTTLRDVFHADPVPEESLSAAARSLDRLARIFEVATHHFVVVETLNTKDYLDFRDKLFPASGFQSAQMREMEILLGLEDDERVGLGARGAWRKALAAPGAGPSPAEERVRRREAAGPSLRAVLDDWLHRTPIRGSQPRDPGDAAAVDRFLADYLESLARASEDTVRMLVEAGAGDEASVRARHGEEVARAREFFLCEDRRRRRIRAALVFIESYRDLPLLAWPRRVLASLANFEQATVIWRQRHARMVERVIGRRTGTGGSSGVDYLDQSANAYRVFRDLWTVRTFQVGAAHLPPLPNASFYGFAHP